MAEKLAKTPQRKVSALLLILMLIIVIGAAGSGYYLWTKKNSKPEANTVAAKELPAAKPIFFALDPFTVNLSDTDRVLYIGITLRTQNESTRETLNAYLPEVRSRLILLFSRQTPDDLATEQGKQKLIEEIKQVLAVPLVSGQPSQVITDVLYTTFILR